MPMIYRRSNQVQVQGRAGAISNVLPSRTGSDGAFLGSPTWSATTSHLTSATAAFVAGDVGRLVLLTNTPSKRYDGVYIIDSIVSGTEVVLRKNHNISGHPGSFAQFGETGSSITWRISESCTFTADGASDFSQTCHPGSYILIQGSANGAANNGQWRISQFLTGQTVMLCKSYLWWVADTVSYTAFTSNASTGFVAETGLYWYVCDREPANGADFMETTLQAWIDAGWALWQSRGSVNTANQTQNILGDYILRSVGEADANLPEGKVIFVRLIWAGKTRSVLGAYTNIVAYIGVGNAYDRTQTPGTSPGAGVGFTRGNNASSPIENTWNMTTIAMPGTSGIGLLDNEIGQAGSDDLLTIGRAGQPLRNFRKDFQAWGDADEVHARLSPNAGVGTTGTRWLGVSSIKPVGQNPFNCAIAAAATGGGTATLTVSTGAHDLSTVYNVGDRVYVRGMGVGTAEYVEGGTIASFTNTGGVAPFGLTITALAATWAAAGYANAVVPGETYRGFVGADPFPAVAFFSNASNADFASASNLRMHNTPNLQNATGKDFDATNLGVGAVWDPGLGANAMGSTMPNFRSGNPGVTTVQVRYDTNSEFRGLARKVQCIRGDVLSGNKRLLEPASGSYWVIVGWAQTSGTQSIPQIAVMAGPFTKAMIGAR